MTHQTVAETAGDFPLDPLDFLRVKLDHRPGIDVDQVVVVVVGRFLIAGAAIAEVTGQVPVENTAGGTSDGRFIAPLGAQVVEVGPVNASIHKVDENLPLVDLETLPALYLAIARRMLAA